MKNEKSGFRLPNWLWPRDDGYTGEKRRNLIKLRIKTVLGIGCVVVGVLYWGVKAYYDSYFYLESQLDYVSEVLPERGNRSTRLQWLDNETLVFVGLQGERKTNKNNWSDLHYKLFRWKLGDSEEAIKDPDLDIWHNSPRVWKGEGCSAKGKLTYIIKNRKITENKYEQVVRTIENEKTTQHIRIIKGSQVKGRLGDVRQKLPGKCERVERFDLEGLRWQTWPDGKTVLVTKKIGKMVGDMHIEAYVQRENGRKIFINIPSDEITSLVKYSEYDNSFLAWDSSQVGRQYGREDCIPYWRIWKDGRSVRDCFVMGEDWHNAGLKLYITKNAPFLVSFKGDGGGYLIENKKLSKVVKGYLYNVTISPDGCKIAFNFLKKGRDAQSGRRGFRVGVINACNKK